MLVFVCVFFAALPFETTFFDIKALKTGKMYNPKDLRRKILKLNPYFFIDRNESLRREGNLDSIDTEI